MSSSIPVTMPGLNRPTLARARSIPFARPRFGRSARPETPKPFLRSPRFSEMVKPRTVYVSNAASALSRMIDPRVLPASLTAWQSAQGHLWQSIGMIIGDVADERAVVPLLAGLRQSKLSSREWRIYVLGLSRIDDPRVNRALRTVLAQRARPRGRDVRRDRPREAR